ncbi:MAG: C4-dicarboxylate ABC transporter [Betaproteobacteria bacterium]|uniref:C4-dicarboxylate ABC transporter n=1 Tax=Candidatus Proximibacter danicus TaxID=2954365 RepID=A0A9D7PSG1_9PROT|nr:C4-dicarboxylate ABC transporter [Candidatus Proximibacter danicus]
MNSPVANHSGVPSGASPKFPSFSEISRSFAPGWFAAVMGTGVLALTAHSLSGRWPFLTPLVQGLHWFNVLLFCVLSVPWLTRWLRFHEAAMMTLRHPVQASFYPTFAIAMLVLAAQWLAIAGMPVAALAFWWGGTALVFVFSFAVLFQMFRGEHVDLEHVTPAKFIPAVGLVVIPVAGGPLLELQSGAMRELALLVNILGLGAGTMMYLGLLGLTLQRKLLAKPAVGILTPTAWIHLAPLGVIPVSLLNVLDQLPFAVAHEPFLFISLLLWGFGVWWLVMASLLTWAARRAGQMPFALSWWGFTFPLGVFVAASLRLSPLTGIGSVDTIGVACWFLLLLVWGVTLVNTVRGVISGAVFRPHP